MPNLPEMLYKEKEQLSRTEYQEWRGYTQELKMKMVIKNFGREDITVQATLPPSLVTFCHQIWLPPLPLPPGDVLFEWPLTKKVSLDCKNQARLVSIVGHVMGQSGTQC